MNTIAGLGIAGFSGIAIVVFWVLLTVLAILLPFSAYAAQKWAYKNYKETSEINVKLNEILSILQKTSTNANVDKSN